MGYVTTKENQNFVWQEMPNYGLSVTPSKHTVKYPSKNNSEETASWTSPYSTVLYTKVRIWRKGNF